MITLGYRNRVMGIFLASGAIITGIIFLSFPGKAIEIVVRVMAAFLVASGIVSYIYGLKTREDGGMSLMVVNAAVDIILGILVFVFAAVIGRFILMVLGILLVVFSIRSFLALLASRKFVKVEFWAVFLPILTLVGGSFLIFNPFSPHVMGILCGSFLLVFGISELISVFKVNKAINEYDIKMTDIRNGNIRQKEDEFADIQDVDCQKMEE